MNRNDLMDKIREKIRVEGRSSTYNPLIQKPVQLNPIGPGNYANGIGGYAYVGPPPDFGGSYGSFKDEKGNVQIGIKASKLFSMRDGSPMQLQAELSPEEREALLAQLDHASELHKCQHCRSELCISVASEIESEKVYCPYCSSEMDGAMDKIKSCLSKLKENEMSKVAATASKDIAKEAMKVETPQQQNPHEKAEKAQMVDHSEAEKKADEMKPMEDLQKDMVKAEADEAAAAAAAKAKEEAEAKTKAEAAAIEEKKATEKKEKLRAALEKYRAARRARKEKAEAAAAAKKTAFDSKTLSTLKRELRVMATLEPEKFAEIRKHENLSEICAQIEKTLHPKETRAQVRAELKALASEDMQAAEEAKKELEFVAPEILIEEPVEFEKKEEEHKAEGEMEEEAEEMEAAAPAEAAPAPAPEAEKEEEKAEAMKTEFLASLETLKGERIEMSLYGEEMENPFWNVTIDGEPVARIHLADQEDAQAIRASFVTEAYADNLGKLIGEMGVQKILPMVKAKFFAHRIDESEVTARLREKARLEAKAEMEEKIGTLRSDFLRAVSTVIVAADKNFFQEEGRNALKGGLFNALVQAGLTEQHAVWAIEAGFESAPEYFNFVMDKAVEMMDMPKEARDSFEKTIQASGRIDVQAGEQPEEEENLVSRLVKSSVSAIAMGGIASGENRDGIRKQMGLKSTRK